MVAPRMRKAINERSKATRNIIIRPSRGKIEDNEKKLDKQIKQEIQKERDVKEYKRMYNILENTKLDFQPKSQICFMEVGKENV